MTEAGAGYVRLAYDDVDADLEPGTDAAALADATASYTALRAICADHPGTDLPDRFDLPGERRRRAAGM